MSRYVIITSFLVLAFAAASAFAAGNSSGKNEDVHAGGLVCRSVDGQHGQSCDALCAKVDMACVGVASQGRDPPLTCGGSMDDTIPPFPVCRCCAVGK
jgi:hypothetical protein